MSTFSSLLICGFCVNLNMFLNMFYWQCILIKLIESDFELKKLATSQIELSYVQNNLRLEGCKSGVDNYMPALCMF